MTKGVFKIMSAVVAGVSAVQVAMKKSTNISGYPSAEMLAQPIDQFSTIPLITDADELKQALKKVVSTVQDETLLQHPKVGFEALVGDDFTIRREIDRGDIRAPNGAEQSVIEESAAQRRTAIIEAFSTMMKHTTMEHGHFVVKTDSLRDEVVKNRQDFQKYWQDLLDGEKSDFTSKGEPLKDFPVIQQIVFEGQYAVEGTTRRESRKETLYDRNAKPPTFLSIGRSTTPEKHCMDWIEKEWPARLQTMHKDAYMNFSFRLAPKGLHGEVVTVREVGTYSYNNDKYWRFTGHCECTFPDPDLKALAGLKLSATSSASGSNKRINALLTVPSSEMITSFIDERKMTLPIRFLRTILPVGAPVVHLRDHTSGTISKREGANYFIKVKETGLVKPCAKEELFQTEELPLAMADRAKKILTNVFGGKELPAAMKKKDCIEVLKQFFLDVATSYVWYSVANEFLRWHLSDEGSKAGGFRQRAVGTLVANDSWRGNDEKMALACCNKLIHNYSTVMKSLNIQKATYSFSAPGDAEDYDAKKLYEVIQQHPDKTRLFSLLAGRFHFDKYPAEFKSDWMYPYFEGDLAKLKAWIETKNNPPKCDVHFSELDFGFGRGNF